MTFPEAAVMAAEVGRGKKHRPAAVSSAHPAGGGLWPHPPRLAALGEALPSFLSPIIPLGLVWPPVGGLRLAGAKFLLFERVSA